MALPVTRYNNFREWIPETDINGVVARKEILRKAQNVDYSGTFIEPAVAPSASANPPVIQSQITAGYSLISSKLFHHSKRGWTWFYVMYKDPEKYLKFYVREDGTADAIELSIDERNDDTGIHSELTFEGQPGNINYAFANDCLKINLNTKATYGEVDSKEVILNLSLQYIKARSYKDDISANKRSAGWLLVPRWNGWQYTDDTDIEIVSGDSEVVVDKDNYAGLITAGSTGHSVSGSNIRLAAGGTALIAFEDITSLRKVKIEFATGQEGQTFEIIFLDSAGDLTESDEVVTATTVISGYPIVKYFDMEFNLKSIGLNENNVGAYFQIRNTEASSTLDIEAITLTGYDAEEIVVLQQFEDKQRGMILNSEDNADVDTVELGVFGSTSIELKGTHVDWRVTKYELYVLLPDTSVYVLVATAEVPESSGGWTADLLDSVVSYKIDMTYQTLRDATETLNFNYGLGATIKVFTQQDNDDFGIYIEKEVVHRGRVYAVTGLDNLIRQTHIAGSGLIQPDSFPFDEGNLFGYFDIPESEIAKGLAVTSLDELAILTNVTEHTYYIQGGQLTFRKTRAVNGGSGLYSGKQLATLLDGRPVGQVFAWYDYTGIYIYGGGISAPKDISIGKIQQYWLELSKATKDSGIVFYNKLKNEIWIVLGTTILLYELFYDRWRTYVFEDTVIEYLGYKENVLYFLNNNNEIMALDYSSSGRLTGVIQTHYTTDLQFAEGENNYAFPSAEQVRKVMNDFSVSSALTSGDNTKLYDVAFFIDGNGLGAESVKMRTDLVNDLIPALPYLAYGKLSIQVTLPNTDVKLNEISYTFITLEQPSARIVVPAASLPSKVT